MEIKGVNIQSEENYYKILSVIKNREVITVKEIRALNSFLKSKDSKEESINILSENETITNKNKGFSALRGLALRENYSFFNIK